MSQLVNQVRCYHYISSVLAGRQEDPLCRNCKAFSNSISAMTEGLAGLEHRHQEELNSLPEEMRRLFNEARDRIVSICMPDNAFGQKKAGNCRMPEGVCFVKLSKAILNKI